MLGNNSWNQVEKPRALMCHICGREYGTTSLKIHLPQCEKLWLERESQKPKSERRPLPKPVVLSEHGVGGGGGGAGPAEGMDMQQYNDAAYKQYQTQSMVTCQHCGRRFADDRIHIHHRSCTADKPAKRVEDVAVRTTTGQAPPHRLDALAHNKLNSPSSNTESRPRTSAGTVPRRPTASGTQLNPSSPAYTYNAPSPSHSSYEQKESASTPKSVLKSPTRPTTGKLEPMSPTSASARPKVPPSPRPPAASAAGAVDVDDYNQLKSRVAMLEEQLDMLLSTITPDKNPPGKSSMAECVQCGVIGAAAFCSECGAKQS